MNTPTRSPVSNQFSIKRLFWTMIVASVFFKLADMLGLLSGMAQMWNAARGNQAVVVIISIIVFTVISIVYIAWFGIRFPHLIEQQVAIQRKRKQRRNEYRQLLESKRKNQSE